MVGGSFFTIYYTNTIDVYLFYSNKKCINASEDVSLTNDGAIQ